MKHLLFSLVILTGFLAASAQDTIPNPSFERWYNYSTGEYPYSWSTSDSISAHYGGGTSVSSSTDAYDGTKSMLLKSVQVTIFVTIKGPGIATNGLVNLDQTTFQFLFSGGSPDTARSRFLTGYYKYLPTSVNDAAVVKAYLFKSNGAGRDTIAAASTELLGTVNTYTQFVLPMVFRDFLTQPDTCLIILQSSRGLNDPDIGVGTEFYVDSLNFSGFVGIDELKNSINSVNLFPTPANRELNIDVELKTNISLSYEIFDINGRVLQSSLMSSTKEKVDVSNLATGSYILKIGDLKKNLLYSTSFSIAR